MVPYQVSYHCNWNLILPGHSEPQPRAWAQSYPKGCGIWGVYTSTLVSHWVGVAALEWGQGSIGSPVFLAQHCWGSQRPLDNWSQESYPIQPETIWIKHWLGLPHPFFLLSPTYFTLRSTLSSCNLFNFHLGMLTRFLFPSFPSLFLWMVLSFFCLLNKSKLEGETLVTSLLFFVHSHWLGIFSGLITSNLASLQITPSVLHIIMFNDLAVEIKIYLKVFRKKKTLGIFYNSTEWKIYKCLLGVIQELHFPLTVWEIGSIYDSACNQWSIMFQGNGKVLYQFRICH